VFPVRYELHFYILVLLEDVQALNIRALNLAAVKLTTVQVSKLPL
jgi:hypothetical protein